MKAPGTREEIRALLTARGLEPIHRLGQNFLVRRSLLAKIADLARLTPGEVVLEPGPGTGGLTEHLLDRQARVVAIEIDRGLVAHLHDLFTGESRLRVLEGDVLDSKSAIARTVWSALEAEGAFLPDATWSVVANLPYQISSPFLCALAIAPHPPRQVVVMLQSEVGRVLAAHPGDADYSALSFLGRIRFRVEKAFSVPREAFWPVPKVSSVVMRLEPLPAGRLAPEVLFGVVRLLFQSRRKKLARTLPRAIETVHGSEAGDRAKTRLAEAEFADIEAGARIDGVDPRRVADFVASVLKTS